MKTKLIYFIMGIILFSCLSMILYHYIFYPAYLSVQRGCNVIDDSELKVIGYYVSGYVSNGNISYFDSNDSKIDESLADKKIIRHENCHVWENDHKLYHSCNLRIFRYMDELICYSYQYMP